MNLEVAKTIVIASMNELINKHSIAAKEHLEEIHDFQESAEYAKRRCDFICELKKMIDTVSLLE